MNRLLCSALVMFMWLFGSQTVFAQETTADVDPMVAFASVSLGCPTENIHIVRRSSAGAIVSVCGSRYIFHLTSTGQIRNLGSYRDSPAPVTQYQSARRYMPVRRARLQSDPGLWATGLGMFLATWLINSGGTAMMVGQAWDTSHFPDGTQLNRGLSTYLGVIPFLGPMIAVAHFDQANAAEWTFAVFGGVFQVVSFILIGAGSRRVDRSGVRASLDGVVVSF